MYLKTMRGATVSKKYLALFDRVGKIKQKLEHNGYWIDELESSDGDIRICSNLSSLPMYFDSWKEIKEWIDEVAEID